MVKNKQNNIFRSNYGSVGAPQPWHLDRGTSLVQTQRPWTVVSALSMSTPTPHPQMMMGPPICPPWMFPQMMGAQPAFEDGGQAYAAYARVPGFRNGMEKQITTAGFPIYKLPKVRLGESIEFLEETLATRTSTSSWTGGPRSVSKCCLSRLSK